MYTIIIIGCGGTGSQLLSPLFQLCNNIKSKINRIVLIDNDIFENKNLTNQKATIEDVGYCKSYALARRYSYIYDELNIEAYENYITNYKQLSKIASYHSNLIVVGCVDNNATRKIINTYFNLITDKNNLIYIDSGNGTDERIGQIVVGYKNYKEVLLTPVADVFDKIKEDNENIENVGTCMRISDDNPQNIATNCYAASILFNILTNILMFDKIENHITFFNANTNEVYTR